MLAALAFAGARSSGANPAPAPTPEPSRAVVMAERTPVEVARSRPFRRSPFRTGDATAGGATALSDAVQAPPAVPLAPITVQAIVGGPPWGALLLGLPGTAGPRVVRPGDRFDPVQVMEIQAERVTLASTDSSWSIALPGRRP